MIDIHDFVLPRSVNMSTTGLSGTSGGNSSDIVFSSNVG